MVNALATYRKARNRVDLAKRVTERSKGLLDHGAIAAEKDYEDTVADYNDAMTDVQNSLHPEIFGITQREIDARSGRASR